MISKDKRFNNSYIIILSALLLLLFAAAFSEIDAHVHTDSLPLTVVIRNNRAAEEIKPWFNDGKWYFFLPSYANAENSALQPKAGRCYLQNIPISKTTNMDSLEFGKDYQFEQRSIWGNCNATIIFMKSSNVATMYVSTASGKMDHIYEDKNYKEKSAVLIFDEFGNSDYIGRGSDTIKGRGNSTWSSPKKPFKLTLARNASLLGMASAKDWVLLANGYDETNLRDKLIYDFAASVDAGWSPHCEFVDVYLNGEYNGLYLLSEKVEVHNNRLQFDQPGDYLIESVHPDKLRDEETNIHIDSNRYFRVEYPKKCTSDTVSEIKENIHKLDEDIKQGNLQSLDLDSWVKRFLIDEFFLNADMVYSSSFYHYDSASRTYIAGPIWDYDLSFGNDASPWTAKSVNPNQILGIRFYWYNELYSNSVFYERLKQIYQSEFLPALEILEENLTSQSAKIYDSSVCNSIRWDAMFKKAYSTDKELNERIDELSAFLGERLAYLEPVWCTDRKFETIRWYAADQTTLIRITLSENGKPIDQFPAPNGETETDWFVMDSNTAFDLTQPITESISLYSVAPVSENTGADVPSDSGESHHTTALLSYYMPFLIMAMLCGAIGLAGIVLLYLDFKRNWKGAGDGRT